MNDNDRQAFDALYEQVQKLEKQIARLESRIRELEN